MRGRERGRSVSDGRILGSRVGISRVSITPIVGSLPMRLPENAAPGSDNGTPSAAVSLANLKALPSSRHGTKRASRGNYPICIRWQRNPCLPPRRLISFPSWRSIWHLRTEDQVFEPHRSRVRPTALWHPHRRHRSQKPASHDAAAAHSGPHRSNRLAGTIDGLCVCAQ